MKKRTVFIIIICSILLLALVIITWGGIIYYSHTLSDRSGLEITIASLQNTWEVLLFNPILPYREIIENLKSLDLTAFQNVILSIYGWAVMITPLVDLLIVFSVLRSVLHIFSGNPWNKRRIMIIGYNDHVKKLINTNDKKTNKIYLWTEELLPDSEVRNLFFTNVWVKMNESPLNEANEDHKSDITKINRFLRLHRIEYVLLVDDSDSRNFQYYMVLSHCRICEKRTIHFFVLNDSFEMQKALADYFDSRLSKIEQNDTHMDLRIFNFPQIQAEILLSEKMLFSEKGSISNDNKDIHMLVIGGGQVGEYLVLHAMNQGVLTDKNDIFIDIIDKEPLHLYRRLRERFHAKYVLSSEQDMCFIIPPEHADGRFVIRITKADVYDPDFTNIIRMLTSDSYKTPDDKLPACKEFTFAAVCIPDDDANLHCVLELQKCLGTQKRIPLALRLSNGEEIRSYFKSFKFVSAVYLMGRNEEYIGLNEIINPEEEKEIRKYHYIYDTLSPIDQSLNSYVETKSNIAWNKQPYYKRQSNRALFFHQAIKDQEEWLDIDKKTVEDFWEYVPEAGETPVPEEKARREKEAALSKKLQEIPELEKFAKAEHRRFCYYYASEGWGFGDLKEPKTRLQNCLCRWKDLVKKGKGDPENKETEEEKKTEEAKETYHLLVYDLITTKTTKR